MQGRLKKLKSFKYQLNNTCKLVKNFEMYKFVNPVLQHLQFSHVCIYYGLNSTNVTIN